MNRRDLIAALSSLAAARSLLATVGEGRSLLGMCTFSCHQHWKAIQAGEPGVKFSDAISFYRYARKLGAEGVQTPLRSKDTNFAKQIRAFVEINGGYYEGDLRMPRNESDVAEFESDVRLAREAGATVARTVFTSGRRYEAMKSAEEFRAFQRETEKSLALVEPVLRKHRLKLAIENHKDYTADELVALMCKVSSEWIGVLVDTGNNIALLDEPHAAVEALAPFALSVHLKDMAVQPSDDGFLLSEVPLGAGILDLPRIITALRKANPSIVFNLEMATRDPLRVPCLKDAYFATMPDQKGARLDATIVWVNKNPAKRLPPHVSGKPTSQILIEEEANNRECLDWMQTNLRVS